jgi:REP element-mobilizing transposase RayT
MKFDPADHHRKSIRLKGYDYAQSGGYFVTLVTLWREYLFGEIVEGKVHQSPLGRIVDECWRSIPEHFPNVELGAYVVMPNHIHGIIIIYDGRGTIYRAPTHYAPIIERFGKPTVGSLPTIVRTFKSTVTRRAERELNSGNIWQRNYYEHILRDQADWERISTYIADNPLNWGDDEENPANAS